LSRKAAGSSMFRSISVHFTQFFTVFYP